MNFSDIKTSFFRNFKILFLPKPKIGGLQISSSLIRYTEFSGPKEPPVSDIALRLPPGLIEKGKIKDRAGFLSALVFLKHKINANSKKRLNVVLTVPSDDVYVEAFNVPALSGKLLDNAISLNMEMTSPNPINESYYSWKVINPEKEGAEKEVLGAFIPKAIIDDLSAISEEAGFGIVAVEFSNLSFVRALNSLNLIDGADSCLLIKLTEDGLGFMIVRNKELYFSLFHPWEKVLYENNNVPIESVFGIIDVESQRVLNFHYSHWGAQINKIIIITPTLKEEITNYISSKYPSFKLTVLDPVKEKIHAVRGAAIRGTILRSEDDNIDLIGEKTTSAFWQDQIFNAINIWRSSVFTAIGFIIIAFTVSLIILVNQNEKLLALVKINPIGPELAELSSIQTKITYFNDLVLSAKSAKDLTKNTVPLIKKINSIASDYGITISRFALRANSQDVDVSGYASTQERIINFKNNLLTIENIQNVSLPLSAIYPSLDQGFSFMLRFSVKDLNSF